MLDQIEMVERKMDESFFFFDYDTFIQTGSASALS